MSQSGELTFRYPVKPHLSGFIPVFSNQFGMEQYQPLVASTVNREFEAEQLLSFEGSQLDSATVFKTSEDGKSALLRLRSLSDKNELVHLRWHDRKPSSIQMFDLENENLSKKFNPKFLFLPTIM